MSQHDSGYYISSKGDVISPPEIGTGVEMLVNLTDQQASNDVKIEFTTYVLLKIIRIKWKGAPEGSTVCVNVLNPSDVVVSRMIRLVKIEGDNKNGVEFNIKDEDIDEGHKLQIEVNNAPTKVAFFVYGEFGIDRENTV